MTFSFQKMQACGNDFVVIDHRLGIPAGFTLPPELAAKICHRQFGVGCDQLLWLQPTKDPSVAEAEVLILNADGTEAEMCGNGMRAAGVLIGRGLSDKSGFKVETASGLVSVSLSGEFPSVSIGTPRVIALSERLTVSGLSEYLGAVAEPVFTRIDMGNPHAVFFLPKEERRLGPGRFKGAPESAEYVLASAPNDVFGALADLQLARWGRAIELNPAFGKRTNVEFVEIEHRRKVRVRVWERGAGATLACGSGACAVVAAAEALGFTDSGETIEVVLPGGTVYVRLESGWQKDAGVAHLSGPADVVFSGEWRG